MNAEESNKGRQWSIEFKRCDCPPESWERIVIDHDDEFNSRTTIHHHCSVCGVDFAVTDFETGEILHAT